MKTKVQIFSNQKLHSFFSNLNEYFNIQTYNLEGFEKNYDQLNVALVFFDSKTFFYENFLKKIINNEGLVFICKDLSVFHRLNFKEKKTIICPLSINKLVDVINNLLNSKKYQFESIEIYNHFIINSKTRKKLHLTQAENHILIKLFVEKNLKKHVLEREVLHIKQELNTSSIESHLNRIRKKLKAIESCFTISSRDRYVSLEKINQDK